MCSAQSTFFYGVFVKTAYLCFASDAYKKIKGSLLGIDLICARRRKGTLTTTEGHESVKRVPEEVWKMVKAEAAGIAVFEAERRVVGYYSNPDLWDGEGDYNTVFKWKGKMMHEWALRHLFDEGGMGEMLRSRSEVTSTFSLFFREGRFSPAFTWSSQDIDALLQPYGLVLPFSQPKSYDESFDYDLDCLSAISLPLLSTDSPTGNQAFPSASLKRSEDYGSVRQAVKFSKRTFALSPSADHRIKSFLSMFRLHAVSNEMQTVYSPQNVKTGSISHATESKTVNKEDLGKTAHEAVCCQEPDAQPHWHMWTVSYC